MKYQIGVTASFDGVFIVEADSIGEAKLKTGLECFGVVGVGTVPEDILNMDYDFSTSGTIQFNHVAEAL